MQTVVQIWDQIIGCNLIQALDIEKYPKRVTLRLQQILGDYTNPNYLVFAIDNIELLNRLAWMEQ